MKVTIGDTRALHPAARGQTAGDDGLPMRWRAELERAQWQARQRHAPQRAVGTGAAPDARGSAAARTWPASRPGEVPVDEGVASGAAREATASRLSATPSLPARPVMPDAPVRTLSAAGGSGVQPVALPDDGPTASAPTAGTRGPGLLPDLTSWLPQASQVCVQGARVSVVLRDADLAPDDWPTLREQLRARCAADGLELADLTINGVSIEPEPGRG